MLVGMWKIFAKAGQPGWAVLIPIYNLIVFLQIVKKPIWWVILLIIPVVNIVLAIILNIEMAKAFGKDAGYAVGLIFLPFIFIPIIGLGDAKYVLDNEQLQQ